MTINQNIICIEKERLNNYPQKEIRLGNLVYTFIGYNKNGKYCYELKVVTENKNIQ